MISVENLSFAYGHAHPVLSSVGFRAQAGQCVAVLGNNGAGKSTMIKCIDHILKPGSGTVVVDGSDVSTLKRQEIAAKMAYVSQNCEGGKLTVYDSVLLGRKPYIKLNPTAGDHAITKRIIIRMGLQDLQLRYIDELSGGEVQKVMLARALAQQPRVLMLDEPTSNLDLKNQYEVMKNLRELAREDSICVIIVIHDLNLAVRYCDRFLFIKDREVYSYGGPETVNKKSIRDVYGMDVEIRNIAGHPTIVPL